MRMVPKRWLQLGRQRDTPCPDFRVAYLAATARLQGWQRNMTMFGCPDRKMPISNPYCHTPVPQEKHCQRHSGPNNWLSDLTLCNWTVCVCSYHLIHHKKMIKSNIGILSQFMKCIQDCFLRMNLKSNCKNPLPTSRIPYFYSPLSLT